MNDLKFLIVEKNPDIAQYLKEQLQGMGFNPYKVVQNTEAAIECVNKKEVDAVILDIALNDSINGLQLAVFLKKENLPILFINSSDASNTKGTTNVLPIGYIVKPFHEASLQHALHAALNFNKETTVSLNPQSPINVVEGAFYIKQNNLLRKIAFDRVLWIKTEGNYSIIYTETKRYILKLSLKKVLEQLPKEYFLQIQRAYIVAIAKIEDIDMTSNEVIIQKERLPLGRNYRDALFNRLNIIR
jgi:DNA-binding LytR/AlgR family response regulator